MRRFHVNSEHLLGRFPFFSVAEKSRKLASQAFFDESKRYRKKQERKYFFHALMNPRFASRWFELMKTSEFKFITKHRPKLYFKPFRVYISIKWNKKQKVKVIRDTYRFIMKSEAFTHVITVNQIEIAQFQLREGMEGILRLGYDFRYRKEGELVLSFECEQLGGVITAAAFSFEEIAKDKWVCRIGCIQGHLKNELYSAKAAQKLMHGLRPKSFIVFAVQEFSMALGFTAVYGVGDSIQANHGKHFIHIPFLHKIPFDYDALWKESGGLAVKEGWYELPLKPVRKGIQKVKTNKRSLYLRRYNFMDSISMSIGEAASRFLPIIILFIKSI